MIRTGLRGACESRANPSKDKATAMARRASRWSRPQSRGREPEEGVCRPLRVYGVTNSWEHFSGEKEQAQAKNIADASQGRRRAARDLVDAGRHAQADDAPTSACRCCRNSIVCPTSTPKLADASSRACPPRFPGDVVLTGTTSTVRLGRRRTSRVSTAGRSRWHVERLPALPPRHRQGGVWHPQGRVAVRGQDRRPSNGESLTIEEMGKKLSSASACRRSTIPRRRSRTSIAVRFPGCGRDGQHFQSTATSRRGPPRPEPGDTRSLNPQLQNFATFLQKNKDRSRPRPNRACARVP